MLQKGIRNIGISEEFPYGIDSDTKRDERDKGANLCRIINDRMILQFLLSHSGREVLRGDGEIRGYQHY